MDKELYAEIERFVDRVDIKQRRTGKFQPATLPPKDHARREVRDWHVHGLVTLRVETLPSPIREIITVLADHLYGKRGQL